MWHLHLCQINLSRIQRLVKEGPLSHLEVDPLLASESCLERKMTKRPLSSKGNRAIECLELVHIDVCCPINIQARGDYEYFIVFMDDFSWYGYVYLMHRKSESFEMFKEFKAKVERQLGKPLKALRSHHGG